MTRAGQILEIADYLSNSANLKQVATGAGSALVGAGLLKAHQKIKKARSKHGTVRRAAHVKSRQLGAKGIRKGTQLSSANMYKLAKRLEKPLPKKSEAYDMKADWKKTKERNPNLAKSTGAVASTTRKAAGKAKSFIGREIEKTKASRHARKIKGMERKKERIQKKHDLRTFKKQLKADQKLYKYDPLIH